MRLGRVWRSAAAALAAAGALALAGCSDGGGGAGASAAAAPDTADLKVQIDQMKVEVAGLQRVVRDQQAEIDVLKAGAEGRSAALPPPAPLGPAPALDGTSQ